MTHCSHFPRPAVSCGLKIEGVTVDIVSDSVTLILGDHTNCTVQVRHLWILFLASQNRHFKRLQKKRDF